MSYVDAGYAVALTVVAGYAVSLWARRRRLERLVRALPPPEEPGR